MPVEDDDFPPDVVATDPPATTGTTPRGPSVTTPDLDLEPHRDAAEDTSEQEETTEPLPEFDPKHRLDFEGLLYLGALTHEFTYLGHAFKIRTLSTDEVLEIGLLHRPYVDTLSDVKAYQAALVAACVVTVDGKPLPMPITNDVADTPLANRFAYVRRSWFPPILDAVYEQYLLLEGRVDDVLRSMGNPSR
jgi:hypothetical protein